MVLLQGSGEELRGGVGFIVAQHDHGHIQIRGVRVLHALLAFVVHAAEQRALRQQEVQDLHQLMLVAAGVVAHVEDQAHSALRSGLLDGGNGVLGRVLLEVADADQRQLTLQHLPGDVDGFDLRPGNGHFPLHAVVGYGQGHVCALLPPHPVLGLRQIQGVFGAVQNGDALHGQHQVADLQSGGIGRAVRRHVGDLQALLHALRGNSNADAHVGIGHRLQIGGIIRRGDIVAPLVVQTLDHAGGCGVGQLVLVQLADEILIHQIVDLGELALPGRRPLGDCRSVDPAGQEDEKAEGGSRHRGQHRRQDDGPDPGHFYHPDRRRCGLIGPPIKFVVV